MKRKRKRWVKTKNAEKHEKGETKDAEKDGKEEEKIGEGRKNNGLEALLTEKLYLCV